MKVRDLLLLIPQEELEIFSSETKIDYQVKKLDGITMFKLLLFSLLNHDKASLRIMENLYSSMQFRMIAGIKDETTRYNSIRDRITTMNPIFFEKIFYSLFDRFSNLFNEQESLIKYDSTMIAISSKLVEWGMKGEKKSNKVQLKYTIAAKGSFPCHVNIFDQKKYLSEDIAISQTILDNNISKTGIVVFDRGVSSRNVFSELTDTEIKFVTRVNTYISYQAIEEIRINKHQSTAGNLIIDEVIKVKLKSKTNVWGKKIYRLIKTHRKDDEKLFYFLTNDFDLSNNEICLIYKQRWEIEIFFKFLKQHLNLSHLVSRNRNGIKVMIYMTLILSILLIAFKKQNAIDSYKITKMRFSQELEIIIVKQIVLLTGGDPCKLPHLFSDT